MFDVRKKHIALHITIFEFESLFDLSSYNVAIASVSGQKEKKKKKKKGIFSVSFRAP